MEAAVLWSIDWPGYACETLFGNLRVTEDMPIKSAPALSVASKAIDPGLHALFASSSGPVKAPLKSRYSASAEKKIQTAKKPDENTALSQPILNVDQDDGEGSNSRPNAPSASVHDDGAGNSADEVKLESLSNDFTDTKAAEIKQPIRERKRKRKDENDKLEAAYLAKLTQDYHTSEPAEKRQKGGPNENHDGGGSVPTHKSLTRDTRAPDLEQAGRTVFISNVSNEAITSKTAKKTLISHLSSVLVESDNPPQKFESIRFRSVAFSTDAIPKRAAFITRSIMSTTTKSTNAYAVFSTPAAARKVASDLNGTEVLGRHIRVDSIAHPSPTDHRRCVFVGNLEFIDDETVINTDKEGNTIEKRRYKVSADVEEGLWRIFGKQGRVENVRVVRDPKTRVGKGFAYVQFYDSNDVEAALFLNGKKFPPMLPRTLRVARAKDPRKTVLAQEHSKAKAMTSAGTGRSTKREKTASAAQQAAAGRASKLLGRAGAALQWRQARSATSSLAGPLASGTSPERVIFEGNRASAMDGVPKDLKMGKKMSKKAGKPNTRSSRRAAEWKKKSKAAAKPGGAKTG